MEAFRLSVFFSKCFLLLLIFTELSTAQVTQSWSVRYNGPGSLTDKSNAIAVDHIGNVFVTGTSPSAGFGTEDYATLKYDSAGVEQWVSRYNGTGSSVDNANAIAVDEAGFIYVTGGSAGPGFDFDFLTIKYSSLGDTLWTRRYDGPRGGNDVAYAITIDDSGNVYVTGESEGSTSPHGIFEDYATIKYTPDGVRVWVVSYNGPAGDYDKANSIDVDIVGNVYVTGVSDGGSSGSGDPHFDYATIKYNNVGLIQWVRRHNGTDNALDEGKFVRVDYSENIVVTGSSRYTGSFDDYFTIKYSPAGDTLWFSRYNGTGNNTDIANSLAVDELGNTFVTGKSYGGSINDFDMVTIKYDSDGDSVWVKRYNGEASDIDEGVDIEVDASGNIYAAGSSTGITTALDYTTIKYDDSGTENWSIKYTNSGAAGSEEQLTGIFVDASSNVYVTGMSALDYATIKYVQSPTSIDDENSQSPDEFFLDQNYPNPFNPSTKIRFVIAIRQLPEKQSQMVLLKVYDVLGNEVATLVDEYLPAGSYEVEFGRHSDESANGGQNLSSGIYFYRLQVGSFVETKKMLMLK